ncbi:leucine-rich repeat-containing protein [Heterostelium album PN500]|uniref:Leucine-rich repeat-containing protein n=1 Tax=Heterostelium pallidum (strain ATCC 26659 / Pp 5 / PN500) TaxID=670386 RepID=D3BK74_HETP5|nr:leucine-rich repeat-containing protein [Heterostelium album PN500]EFA78304.1 leucine-rich repeat-containing protein [Heterostelium album PN500]|eukprot:XP_020430429.1 leucine-rich repeat-containing protein [Heterostelium album PN500]
MDVHQIITNNNNNEVINNGGGGGRPKSVSTKINNMIDDIEFKGILDLSGKQLKRVPRFLADCVDPIVELNLQNNQIESLLFALPQSFSCLRVLNLSHNNIVSLEVNFNSPLLSGCSSPHLTSSTPPLTLQLNSIGGGNTKLTLVSTTTTTTTSTTLTATSEHSPHQTSNSGNSSPKIFSNSQHSSPITSSPLLTTLLSLSAANNNSNNNLALPSISLPPKIVDPLLWMKNLSQLILSNCKIKSIGDTDFTLFPNIQILDLQNNQIQSISQNAFKTNLQLKHIRLCRNSQLSSLSSSITSLANLEFLQVSFCALQTLPIELGNLTSLLVLKLSNNRIEEIPISIGKLERLTHLDISHNLLRTLPLSLGCCSCITEIQIFGNPLEDKTLLANKCSQTIINYLTRRVEDHNYLQTSNTNTSAQGKAKQIQTRDGVSFGSISYLSLNDIFSKIRISRSGGAGGGGANNNNSNGNPTNQSRGNGLKQAKMSSTNQKQAALEFIKNDLKYAIDRIQNKVNDPEVQLDFLLLCGDAIRSTQENFECMSELLKKPQFKFNSETPLPTEDKIVQLKKVINLKIEKATVYSTAIYMYLLRCKSDKEIDQIYTTIMDFHSKLTDF